MSGAPGAAQRIKPFLEPHMAALKRQRGGPGPGAESGRALASRPLQPREAGTSVRLPDSGGLVSLLPPRSRTSR